MAPSSNPLNLMQLIDERKIGAYQKLIVFLGFFIIAMDGFDVSIIGFIAPQLRTEWVISHQALGPVISAALIGLAVGAVVCGPLADRYGRRRVLLASVAFFGIWTVATAMANSVTELVIYRFLTGIGLGSAMPNVGALVSEYSPARRRSFLVTLAFTGFSVGAATGGFMAAWVIPNYGWRTLVMIGGVLPLLTLPLLWKYLPESLATMVVRGESSARIHKVLERIAPGVSTTSTRFIYPIAKSVQGTSKNPIRMILSANLLFGTLMLWLTYFLILFLVYLMGSWLPSMVREEGYSVSQAAIVTALYQIGGSTGALCIGYLMDRFNSHRVLAVICTLGALIIFSLGQVSHHFVLLAVLAYLVGFVTTGPSVGSNALAAQYYPSACRATGMSWMHSAGRWGGILSGFAGAQILSMGWSFQTVFAVLTVPSVIVAVAFIAKGISDKKRGLDAVQA